MPRRRSFLHAAALQTQPPAKIIQRLFQMKRAGAHTRCRHGAIAALSDPLPPPVGSCYSGNPMGLPAARHLGGGGANTNQTHESLRPTPSNAGGARGTSLVSGRRLPCHMSIFVSLSKEKINGSDSGTTHLGQFRCSAMVLCSLILVRSPPLPASLRASLCEKRLGYPRKRFAQGRAGQKVTCGHRTCSLRGRKKSLNPRRGASENYARHRRALALSRGGGGRGREGKGRPMLRTPSAWGGISTGLK
ncbi:unnamed protein product [Trypanosoma congolense IL3000]|uniref:WGS project CAEQ00000000 data, annotated contig 994 n=1 Tax=Trypanosoma congolense (strain IL3000) TaxID=1068625 RepID=F9WK70_TRYCI|nr:unnamed protein product [Trypanosoma congolense IL3000]